MGRVAQRPLGAHSRLEELKASLRRAVRGVDQAPMIRGKFGQRFLLRVMTTASMSPGKY